MDEANMSAAEEPKGLRLIVAFSTFNRISLSQKKKGLET